MARKIVISFGENEEELYQRIMDDIGKYGKQSSWFKDAAERKLNAAQEISNENKTENKPAIDPFGLLGL